MEFKQNLYITFLFNSGLVGMKSAKRVYSEITASDPTLSSLLAPIEHIQLCMGPLQQFHNTVKRSTTLARKRRVKTTQDNDAIHNEVPQSGINSFKFGIYESR